MFKYFANLGTRDKVYLGVSAPLALLVIIGSIGVFTVNTITKTNERLGWVEATLKQAADVSASAVDMQTGMRGYLLAGQEEFLEPYNRGAATTFEKIEALADRVANDPAQVKRLEQAKRILFDWQTQVVEPAIALRRQIGDAETMNDMAKLVAKGDGKEYFDRFRDQIGQVISAEHGMLDKRRREFRAARDAIGSGLETLTETGRAFQSTLSIIAGAKTVLTHAVDMESGIRGYMLAGEAEFLDPFENGREGFLQSLADLKVQVGDDREQSERLDRVKGLMEWWIEQVADPGVELRGQVNDGSRTLLHVDVFVSRQQGKLAFDGIRETMAEFIEVERRKMAERQRNASISDKVIGDAVNTMYHNEEVVSETYFAIAAIDNLVLSAVDMQAGMRGYLLTGREDYLKPYHEGAETFEISVQALTEIFSSNPDQVTRLTEANATIQEWQAKVVEPQIVLRRKIGNAKTMDDMADLVAERRGMNYFDRFRQLISEFNSEEERTAQRLRSETAQIVATSRYAMTGVAFLALVVGLLLAWATGNGIARPLNAMRNVTGRLAGGDMEIAIPGGDRTDEIGEMARALEQIRAVGVKAAQTQSSLNDASSPMTIVDWEGRIVFANKAMDSLYDKIAADLAAELRGFACKTITDARFDALHNHEELYTASLMVQSEPVTVRMQAGCYTLELTASPVYNDMQERLGVVVEWKDLTSRVAVEGEIASIVRQATRGDFSARLSEANKSGFMAELANGVNELLDVVDNGLSQIVKVVSALSEGDLTMRMKGEHAGAFGRLKVDVDRMASQMEDMLGRIAEVSDAVRSATDEILSGITDLSARTEHQASSLEETTASMEQLSVTVRQNADSAEEANQVAAAAQESAVTGGEVAERAVQAMGRIEESSKKITEIVSLMQEIAFQTNLLALNASVEAARAGEAGRGFSVVANEVRALSQRSAQASKDIRELITNSDNQVREGVRLVGEAGAALDEIVTSVKSVAKHVSEIATASREQTGGIEQVSGAITGMDEMTQQNASLVEKANASIRSAMVQVSDLQRAVGFFKTANGGERRSEDGDADGDDRDVADVADAAELHKIAHEMAGRRRDGSQVRSLAEGSGNPSAAVPDLDRWEEF